jgi:hypothetical protein
LLVADKSGASIENLPPPAFGEGEGGDAGVRLPVVMVSAREGGELQASVNGAADVTVGIEFDTDRSAAEGSR